MKRKGILIVLSGPSGAGKGTVRSHLFSCDDTITYSISATTRLPRAGEADGIDYYFVAKARFEEMIRNGELMEWAAIYDYYYGTPEKPVLKTLDQGRDVVLEIDVQGALKVKEKYPLGVYIFLAPPSMEELAIRLRSRASDALEEIETRLSWSAKEIALAKKYNYLVINDDVELAVDKIRAIIKAERCRPWLYSLEQAWFAR
ncbi:MAG: guanylate kinase [Bacillota bacterium]